MAKKVVLLIAAIFLYANSAKAFSLPAVISDNMVLQRDQNTQVWGWGEPGENIVVEFAGQTKEVVVDEDGNWQVTLDPLPACLTPENMTIKSKSGEAEAVKTLKNILVGDVWVCCGQSNMAFILSRMADAKSIIEKAKCPELRLFNVESLTSGFPLDDFKGQWMPCSPAVAAKFSAVGYFFGKILQSKLKIPIGMINPSVGGTRIQQWISMSGYKQVPEMKKDYELHISDKVESYQKELPEKLNKLEGWIKKTRKALTEGKTIPSVVFPTHPLNCKWGPTNLFNGYINPITQFAITGCIWYQGESNWTDRQYYYNRMKALIKGWRIEWKREDLPFYYVQLPPHNYGKTKELSTRLPEIWDCQRRILDIPNTGMAVTTDLGDLNNVHPIRGKDELARRLVLWALANTYHQKDLVFSGPIIKEVEKEGNKLKLSFKFAEDGLKTRDGKDPDWFEVAGSDNKYVKAKVVIKDNSIVVWNDNITEPSKVRFGWNQAASPNLINKTGLPASPFQESLSKSKTP